MAVNYPIPKPDEAVADSRGMATRAWYNFFRARLAESDGALLQEEIDALTERVVVLEEAQGTNAVILGPNSVIVSGSLSDGLVQLSLDGDEQLPAAESYYGTDELGVKGFHPLPDPPPALVPYFIPTDTTYTVPLYSQGLFTMPIDVEGTLEVDGYLIEVD